MATIQTPTAEYEDGGADNAEVFEDDDGLEDIYDEVTGGEDPEADDDKGEAEEPDDDPDEDEDAGADDDDGDGDEEPDADDEADEDADEADDEAEAEESESDGDEDGGEDVAAPEYLAPELRRDWAKVPETVRDAVMRRDDEVARYVADVDQRLKRAEPVDKVTRAYAHTIPQGVGAADATTMLYHAHAMLLEDPVAGMAHIAKTYGLSLAQLAGEAASDEAMQLRIENAAFRANQLRQGQIQALETGEIARMTVDEWQASVPHYDEAERYMADAIKGLPADKVNGKTPAEVLAAAFEVAIRQDDTLYEKVKQARAEQATKPAKSAEAKERAKQTAKAARDRIKAKANRQREQRAEKTRERDRQRSADAQKAKRTAKAGRRSGALPRSGGVDIDDDAQMSRLFDKFAKGR